MDNSIGFWTVLWTVANLYCSHHNTTFNSLDEYGVQYSTATGTHHVSWEEINKYMSDGREKYSNLPNYR